MNLNEKLLKYIDGEMSPEEKVTFETELLSSDELSKQYKIVKSMLNKTSVIKEAKISESYFQNIIPSFRNTSIKHDPVLNPAYAGVLVMIFIFVLTLIFQPVNNIDEHETAGKVDYDLNQEELAIFMNESEYLTEDFSGVYTSGINLDSLITEFISTGIIYSQGTENIYSNYFNINPDEIDISDKDADELYTFILNKKFF